MALLFFSVEGRCEEADQAESEAKKQTAELRRALEKSAPPTLQNQTGGERTLSEWTAQLDALNIGDVVQHEYQRI